jgi:uncharacterized protein YecE (DUF72 family)
MQGNRVYIGTSGWSYKHWKESFYPHKMPTRAWLPHYATRFNTTEINGSFYRLPTQETVLSWMQQVPPHFVFCPKMSRYLTHMKKLKDPEEPLQRFFGIFSPMHGVMGPVLVQLPPQLRFNYDLADHFYGLLHTQYRAYQFVVEIREDSWLHDDSLTLMAKYGIGLVISQSNGVFPYSEMVTAPNIYVRFHGPAQLYASPYSDEELDSWAHKFRSWIFEGHTVWAYFNNDIHGYAFEDARRLRERLGV